MAGLLLVGTEAIGPAAAAVIVHQGAWPQVANGGQLPQQFVAAVGQGGGIERIGHGEHLLLLVYNTNNRRSIAPDTRQRSTKEALRGSLEASDSPAIRSQTRIQPVQPHETSNSPSVCKTMSYTPCP